MFGQWLWTRVNLMQRPWKTKKPTKAGCYTLQIGRMEDRLSHHPLFQSHSSLPSLYPIISYQCEIWQIKSLNVSASCYKLCPHFETGERSFFHHSLTIYHINPTDAKSSTMDFLNAPHMVKNNYFDNIFVTLTSAIIWSNWERFDFNWW